MLLKCLLFCLLPVIRASPVIIGYFDEPLYDFQNSYLSQLIQTAASSGKVGSLAPLDSEPASFEFEFLAFSAIDDLKNCLSLDKCNIALNYGQQLAAAMNQSTFTLPILDDPATYITVPKLNNQTSLGFLMTTYWLLSFFSFFSLASILVLRGGFFGKPTR